VPFSRDERAGEPDYECRIMPKCLVFRNAMNASPSSPVPSSNRDPGSGVCVSVAEKSTPAPLRPVCASMMVSVFVPAFSVTSLNKTVSALRNSAHTPRNGSRCQRSQRAR